MTSALFLGRSRRSRALVMLQSALRDWWETDTIIIGYILKVVLACLLALWLSLRFELDQPRTAMLTVTIVMQPRSGMVFTKSIYRLLGTLVGIAVSFVLVSMFAQERVLFLLCMAIWIGLCTAGSMVFRNHQSYAFVLAGYTLCIVGLPATISPDQTFNIGVTRISEILIGLLSATLVSDLVFPQRMWDMMLATVRRRFSDFSDLLRSVSFASPDAATSKPALLRFVGDIFSLESFRVSTMLENDHSRAQRLRLGLLNAEFMEVSTSYHALEQLLRRQRASGHPEVSTALLDIYQSIGEAISIDGRSARTEQEAQQITGKLKAFRDAFEQRLAAARARLPHGLTPAEHLDFDTGGELLQRFADELYAYAGTYASLASGLGRSRAGAAAEYPLHLESHFDPLAVALAGVRGALALAVMTSLWIFTDWRSGIEAITIGVVTSTLFATAPSPHRTIKQFIGGAVIGTVLAYFYNFQMLPQVQGFLMLALTLTPALAVVAWMTTRPAIAVLGGSTFIIFLSHIGFNSAYSANPITFMNDAIADIIAVLMSGVMYGLIDLSNSRWSRKRIARALRGLVVAACREPLPLRRARLETAARDLVQRTGSTQRIADDQDQEVTDWLLSTLEIGHAVIALREQLSEIDHAVISGKLTASLDTIARLYTSPSTRNRRAAISAIETAMAVIMDRRQYAAASSRHQLLTMLHFIRSALLDEESVLTSVAPLIPAGDT